MADYFGWVSKLRLMALKKLNQVKVEDPLKWEIPEAPAPEMRMETADSLEFPRVLDAFSSFCSCSERPCFDSPFLSPCGFLRFQKESASWRYNQVPVSRYGHLTSAKRVPNEDSRLF
jgi:hypothetical protein